MEAFLSTFHYVCTQQNLLEFLIQTYDTYKPFIEDWARTIRFRVLNVLKLWMKKYSYGEFGEDVFDEHFQKTYRDFVAALIDNMNKNYLHSVDFKVTMKKVKNQKKSFFLFYKSDFFSHNFGFSFPIEIQTQRIPLLQAPKGSYSEAGDKAHTQEA